MGKMERHYLSEIYGDISQEEFDLLLADVKENGFIDPKIMVFEGKILDGWHRYRVASELELIDSLHFVEKPDGINPYSYSKSKNRLRRHLTESQRSQLSVEKNKWIPHGGDRSKSPNGDLKSRKEMAQEANVSLRSIDRSKQVSRLGRSEEVIKGEKSANAVLVEERQSAKPQIEPVTDIPILESDLDEEEWHIYECRRCDHASKIESPENAYCKYCYTTHSDWDYGEDYPQPETPLTHSHLKQKSAEKKQNAGMTNATGNEEWYTPKDYMEKVQLVLGDIDLDPASCEVANETVKAKRYFTKEQDGLLQDWAGAVYINPPYTRAIVAQFTDKLIHHYQRGDVSQAILLVYATTDTDWFQKALSASDAVLFTNARIKFYNVSGTQPGHYGQALFYFGKDTEKFNQVFSDKGVIAWQYNSQMTAK